MNTAGFVFIGNIMSSLNLKGDKLSVLCSQLVSAASAAQVVQKSLIAGFAQHDLLY